MILLSFLLSWLALLYFNVYFLFGFIIRQYYQTIRFRSRSISPRSWCVFGLVMILVLLLGWWLHCHLLGWISLKLKTWKRPTELHQESKYCCVPGDNLFVPKIVCTRSWVKFENSIAVHTGFRKQSPIVFNGRLVCVN